MRPILLSLLFILLTHDLNAQERGQRFGPWDRDLWFYSAGEDFTFKSGKRFVERAGVPSMCRDGKGRLVAAFQWFPMDRPDEFDGVAVVFSEDEGKSWTKPEPIAVKGLPADYQRPFDPTVVPAAAGKMRIYFTSHHPGNRVPATYSALSEDGVNYTFEPGARFVVEGKMVIDATVLRFGGKWHYFAPVQSREGGEGYHAVSEDGLAFKRLENVRIAGRRHWLGNAVVAEGVLRFFGSGEGGIWLAWSRDGATWMLDAESIVRGGDPAVVATKTGWLMVVTGELRDDAGKAGIPQTRKRE